MQYVRPSITGLLSLAALVSGYLTVRAELDNNRERVYQLAPLAMALILVVAILAAAPVATFYKAAIITGLLLTLLADVAVMLPGRNLVLGAAFSLWARILYAYAFGAVTVWAIPSFWGILLLPIPYLLYRWLNAYLLEMDIPVYIYAGVVFIMTWQALEMATQQRELWALLALLGALLVAASDAAQAIRSFRAPFRYANWVVPGTHYLGHLLLALSLHSSFFS